MKKPIIFLMFILTLAFAMVQIPILQTANAASPKTETEHELKISAKSGLLIDADSGTVIFEKNSHERLPIASMTKIASLSVVFDALSKGIVHENDMVTVSENAAAVKGSSAFLDAGSAYKLSDLVSSVIIASANDSMVTLSEYVAGSEDVFVSRMNKLVESLNLKDTHFENSTGLPVNNHYSSAHDIAKIYQTICDNKLYHKFSKIWIEDFLHPSGRKTGLVNTNRLIKTFDGIEGGKTGYTDAARFCLTASAKRGSTRLIGVVIGANDSKTRFAEMTKLLNFGFSNFSSKLVVNSEVPITILNLKNSKEKPEVYAERDSVIFMSKSDERTFLIDYNLNEIKAPLKKGDIVGKLFVFDQNNMVVDEINLVVKKDIEKEKFSETFKKLTEAW